MRKYIFYLCLGLTFVVNLNVAIAEDSSMWQKTKGVADDTWDGTKKVTSDVWDGAKKVTKDVWDGTKTVTGDVKDGLSDDENNSMDTNTSQPTTATETQD